MSTVDRERLAALIAATDRTMASRAEARARMLEPVVLA